MPVLPSEEEAPLGITEKVAKDPSSATESTASEHEVHGNEHTPGKASTEDHQSKGPQIPINMSDMPPKASKEELKARSEELNK
ncbi:hypothetical protein ABVK25_003476 [Lepraria finkii]|uniref:Uncharacterized protein n=1 Tax=Lepraria finkii TaxID=1340010 RepID=A0ABR4BF30_9LECA